VALTWWNSHVKTVTLEVAQALPWKTLKKMMTDKVEKYIGGLPDTIHDSVKVARPKTMQEAIEFANELMDIRIRDVVENKRKFEGTSGNNQNQPQQNKRQNTSRAYAAGNSDRNIYTGSKPLCSKCDYHHEGACPPRCNNYKRVGHLTRDCRSRPANANNNNANNNNRNNNNNTNNNNRNNNNQKEDELVVQEFLEVFPEDLPGIPPTRQVEFRIDLDEKEHEEHLKAILELLKKEELYAKFSKCEFWIPKVQFLSHVIDSQGIHMDPTKIESIKDWASPKSPTEIRQFLGLAGYYRRYVEGFSKIAKPMTKLTQKKVKFKWGDKQEEAF
nr:putative reverse transcriptase domain-containing protein [Tanacetum cinerariifolium]